MKLGGSKGRRVRWGVKMWQRGAVCALFGGVRRMCDGHRWANVASM